LIELIVFDAILVFSLWDIFSLYKKRTTEEDRKTNDINSSTKQAIISVDKEKTKEKKEKKIEFFLFTLFQCFVSEYSHG
jgi:hypothetical protein